MKSLFDRVCKLESGCWNWTGALTSRGYGNVHFNGRFWPAHRLFWFLSKGNPGDLFVLHKCDNRRCVNPEHMFLGTAKDNTRDMMLKGRNIPGSAKGNDLPQAKCTPQTVRKVRGLYDGGWSQAAIAKEVGLGQTTVSQIVRRRTWGHV